MIMHCEYQDTKRIVGQGQHPTGTDTDLKVLYCLRTSRSEKTEEERKVSE